MSLNHLINPLLAIGGARWSSNAIYPLGVSTEELEAKEVRTSILKLGAGDPRVRIPLGIPPETNLGKPGDQPGDLVFYYDVDTNVYLYYCLNAYTGTFPIWFRVALTNSW